jgi:hypothetical protein
MTAAEARQFEKQREDDKVAGVWQVGESPESAFAICAELGRRFAPKLGLRTLDTLHVACVVERQAAHFWTFDEQQRNEASLSLLMFRVQKCDEVEQAHEEGHKERDTGKPREHELAVAAARRRRGNADDVVKSSE